MGCILCHPIQDDTLYLKQVSNNKYYESFYLSITNDTVVVNKKQNKKPS